MRFFRFASFALILLLVGFCFLGIIFPSIKYQFTIDIQAPIHKAYGAIASHDMKPDQYKNIDPSPEKTLVKPYGEGSVTTLTYSPSAKEKFLREEIVKLDSLKYIELQSETENTLYTSKMYFTDKNLVTRLRVEEEMIGRTFVERSYLYVIQSMIKKNREAFYKRKKQIVESTPDYNFRPEERK